MSSFLDQVKKRRLALGLKQHDMMQRVGISRQQYQRLESKGNPRLETLELIAKGLKSELLLVPQEKLNAVLAFLQQATTINPSLQKMSSDKEKTSLPDDPWQDLLRGDE